MSDFDDVQSYQNMMGSNTDYSKTPLPPSPFVSSLDPAPPGRRGRPPKSTPTPVPPNNFE